MRILFSCILVFLLSAISRANSFDLHYQPSNIKITTTEKGVIATPRPFYNGWPALRAARGEWESFQIVITARKVLLKDVRIEPQSFENPLGAPILKDSWIIFRKNYMQIPHPSARNSPPNLWWPDALIPQHLQSPISIEPGKSEVLWLTVRVPRDAKAGNYSSDVTVWANGQKRTIKVLLQVEPFTIPAPTMRANVAVYYDVLRDWYTKNIGALTDAQFAKLKKAYYDFLLQYRINAYDLPVPWNSPEAAQYINNPKVLSVRLPPLSQKEELKTAINVLKKNHAMAKGYYYWIDEPPPQRYPEIIDTKQQLQDIDPAIKQCVTIAPNKILDGSVDIWCPNIGDFLGLNHLDMTALTKQRDKGRETWWYTMVEPKYPYPTWLVDDEALSIRRYGGLMAKYGISGFVYSMAHGWGPDPLNNIASFAGTYGDGTLVYPSELVGGHGPMPSIRLMLLRDAIEDYELMKKYFPNNSSFPESINNYYQLYENKSGLQTDSALFEIMRNDLYQFYGGEKVLFDIEVNKQIREPRYFRGYTITDYDQHGIFSYTAEIGMITANFKNSSGQDIQFNGEVNSVRADTNNFHISITATTNADLTADWVAVELALTDQKDQRKDNYAMSPAAQPETPYLWINRSTAGITRWRFVVTRKGTAVVEKQTSEGRSIVDTIPWKHSIKLNADKSSYTVEMKIPRVIEDDVFKHSLQSSKIMRINFLRHYQLPGRAPVTGRWQQDAGDVFLMPVVIIIPAMFFPNKATP